jgi:uncharacterized membrane protein
VAAATPTALHGDVRRHEDLTTPRRGRRLDLGVHYDPEAFGEFSEAIARTFGTARFLVIQTIVVAAWIATNAFAWGLQWDPYPFILLNLVFSTQAAYAAPLILLAQNRQEDRDRAQAERDREQARRVQADTEFLAREIAGIRLGLSDVVTTADLDERVERLTRAIEALAVPEATANPEPVPPPTA